MQKIILISAPARSGKDTFADMAIEHLSKKGLRAKKVSYAEYLKLLCKKYLGWNGEKDENGRTLLQYVGTDIVREKMQMPNFWVDTIITEFKMFENEYDVFLISDTRFPNEISRMYEEFGDKVVDIAIKRKMENGLTGSQKQHTSEIALEGHKFYATIHNNGTLDELRMAMKLFIDGIVRDEREYDDESK